MFTCSNEIINSIEHYLYNTIIIIVIDEIFSRKSYLPSRIKCLIIGELSVHRENKEVNYQSFHNFIIDNWDEIFYSNLLLFFILREFEWKMYPCMEAIAYWHPALFLPLWFPFLDESQGDTDNISYLISFHSYLGELFSSLSGRYFHQCIYFAGLCVIVVVVVRVHFVWCRKEGTEVRRFITPCYDNLILFSLPMDSNQVVPIKKGEEASEGYVGFLCW